LDNNVSRETISAWLVGRTDEIILICLEMIGKMHQECFTWNIPDN